MSYRWEKFFNAVDKLASGTRRIQERLRDAYIYDIMHVKDEEMPESLQERFATFKHELTKEKAIANEGTVQATTQRMSDEEASKWASEIVSMFIEIVKDES